MASIEFRGEIAGFSHALDSIGFKPRGGSTVHTVRGCHTDAAPHNILIFGGADRAGEHYNDTVIVDIITHAAHTAKASGDIPQAVGGHSSMLIEAIHNGTDVIGKADPSFIVFGGINFVDEVVHNTLYELDLHPSSSNWTGEWRAAATEGTKPIGRTGHTFVTIPIGDKLSATKALHSTSLLFAGSSPAEGPMNDLHALYCFYEQKTPSIATPAAFPSDEASAIASASPYRFRWQPLGTTGEAPSPRELHSCFFRSSSASLSPAIALKRARVEDSPDAPPMMVVVGGRDGEGRVLKTCHVLNLAAMSWLKPIRIPFPVVAAASCASTDNRTFFMYGGWCGSTGLSDELVVLDTRHMNDPTAWLWTKAALTPSPVPPPRFAAACAWASAAQADEDGALGKVIVVGGMEAEKDLNDILEITIKAPLATEKK